MEAWVASCSSIRFHAHGLRRGWPLQSMYQMSAVLVNGYSGQIIDAQRRTLQSLILFFQGHCPRRYRMNQPTNQSTNQSADISYAGVPGARAQGRHTLPDSPPPVTHLGPGGQRVLFSGIPEAFSATRGVHHGFQGRQEAAKTAQERCKPPKMAP